MHTVHCPKGSLYEEPQRTPNAQRSLSVPASSKSNLQGPDAQRSSSAPAASSKNSLKGPETPMLSAHGPNGSLSLRRASKGPHMDEEGARATRDGHFNLNWATMADTTPRAVDGLSRPSSSSSPSSSSPSSSPSSSSPSSPSSPRRTHADWLSQPPLLYAAVAGGLGGGIADVALHGYGSQPARESARIESERIERERSGTAGKGRGRGRIRGRIRKESEPESGLDSRNRSWESWLDSEGFGAGNAAPETKESELESKKRKAQRAWERGWIPMESTTKDASRTVRLGCVRRRRTGLRMGVRAVLTNAGRTPEPMQAGHGQDPDAGPGQPAAVPWHAADSPHHPARRGSLSWALLGYVVTAPPALTELDTAGHGRTWTPLSLGAPGPPRAAAAGFGPCSMPSTPPPVPGLTRAMCVCP